MLKSPRVTPSETMPWKLHARFTHPGFLWQGHFRKGPHISRYISRELIRTIFNLAWSGLVWPGLTWPWPWPHHDTCNGWTAYSQVLPVYHLQPIYDPLFSLVLAWAYDRCFRLSPEHLWWCSALKLENHLKIYLILAYVQTLRRLTPNLCFGQQYLTPACFSKIVLLLF